MALNIKSKAAKFSCSVESEKKNKLENETWRLTWTLKLFHSDKTYKTA